MRGTSTRAPGVPSGASKKIARMMPLCRELPEGRLLTDGVELVLAHLDEVDLDAVRLEGRDVVGVELAPGREHVGLTLEGVRGLLVPGQPLDERVDLVADVVVGELLDLKPSGGGRHVLERAEPTLQPLVHRARVAAVDRRGRALRELIVLGERDGRDVHNARLLERLNDRLRVLAATDERALDHLHLAHAAPEA